MQIKLWNYLSLHLIVYLKLLKMDEMKILYSLKNLPLYIQHYLDQ